MEPHELETVRAKVQELQRELQRVTEALAAKRLKYKRLKQKLAGEPTSLQASSGASQASAGAGALSPVGGSPPSTGPSSPEVSRSELAQLSLSPGLPRHTAPRHGSSERDSGSISADDLEEQVRECARAGNAEKLAHLIRLGAVCDGQDENGYTPLHWAAIHGRVECMAVLIRHGVDINQTDHGGWTALHYAAFKGHKECVNVLICQPELDSDVKNSAKKTAAQVCTHKTIAAVIKEAKHPMLHELLTQCKRFWSQSSLESSLPERVQEKERALLDREKSLLERERATQRLQGELQLVQEQLKKAQQGEEVKRKALQEHEQKINVLAGEVRRKMETQGEQDLSATMPTVDVSEIQFLEEIGHGSYGTIHRAIWRGDYVAAKKLKCTLEDTELIQAFQRESKILGALRHPNVMSAMGACCHAPNLIIVQELMKADLFSILQGKEKLEWKERLQMAVDVARGMNYLHNLQPPLVHRDLKSGNLLVDEYRRVKVSDFGTATSPEEMGTELRGTAAWMSPERLREEPSDASTDVFSFAVVMWELLTRRVPWEGLSNLQIIARVGHAEERLPLPDLPKGCPAPWLALVKQCWDPYPGNRPTFASVLKELREMTL